MKTELQKQTDVPLLHRQRVSFLVDYDGGATPSILQFKELIASTMKVNKDLVAVRHVYQRYGFPQAKVIAHIYTNKNDLVRLEKLKKAERKIVEAEKKAAEEKIKAEKK